MKKYLSMLLTLTLSLTLFTSCMTDKEIPAVSEVSSPQGTEEKVRYLDEKELAFYNEIDDLLRGENNPDVAKPLDLPNSEFELWSEDGHSQELLHPSNKMVTYADESIGLPFVKISASMHANPFANFNVLKKSGLIGSSEKYDSVDFGFTEGVWCDGGLRMDYMLPSVKLDSVKYNYTKSGCIDLLQSINTLETSNNGNSGFANKILSYNDPDDSVFFSRGDNCYYCYYLSYDSGYADVFAIYFKSSDGKYIDEVTTQLLYITFPAGDCAAGVGISVSVAHAQSKFSQFSLIMAIEKALSGQCRYSDSISITPESPDAEFIIEDLYEGANYTAKFKCEEFTIDSDTNFSLESFSNLTYSIKLE